MVFQVELCAICIEIKTITKLNFTKLSSVTNVAIIMFRLLDLECWLEAVLSVQAVWACYNWQIQQKCFMSSFINFDKKFALELLRKLLHVDHC